MDIGTKIKNRRKELGKTLEDVGAAVGVGKSTVRKWEQGMIKNMRRDKIALLAAALDLDPAELIEYEKAPVYSLSESEVTLVRAYRAADDRARGDALDTLLAHPRAKTEENLA